MLREGTKTRDGERCLDLQLLGTNVGAGVGGESGSVSFLSTTEKFAPTLEIMADMLLNPTFPAAALERLREQRLVQLAQANAQPGVIGDRVFRACSTARGIPSRDGERNDPQGGDARRRRRVPREYFSPGAPSSRSSAT